MKTFMFILEGFIMTNDVITIILALFSAFLTIRLYCWLEAKINEESGWRTDFLFISLMTVFTIVFFVVINSSISLLKYLF